LDDLLSTISHHLDDEASERKAIYHRLAAIENEMKRRGSRGFAGLIAFCVAFASIVAWQSYGETTKQIIATRHTSWFALYCDRLAYRCERTH
jgi:hypothetical protein